MKKIMTLLLAALLLTACGGNQEQLSLQDALTNKFKDDPDLKDYKIQPSEVAECVASSIADSMPGFPGDPRRTQYYEAYTRFVTVDSPSAAENAVRQYQDLFGGIMQAREAANSITDHIMNCMGVAVEKHGAETSPQGDS